MTTRGMLICISSPYRRLGLVFSKYRDCYGKDDSHVLVVQGASRDFNATLDEDAIAAARADDPQGAMAEWDGEFRNDLSQFLDDASIDGAIDHGRPPELPPREGIRYHAFCDMSGGRRDASTICIAHCEDGRYFADAIRGRQGEVAAAAKEFADLAKAYRCSSVTGDNFAADWVKQAFADNDREYRRSKLVRSDLYLEGLPLFTRGLVNIPDLPQLIREMRLLERRTARSGRDTVDHGVGGTDDFANSLFGALHLAFAAEHKDEPPIVPPMGLDLNSGNLIPLAPSPAPSIDPSIERAQRVNAIKPPKAWLKSGQAPEPWRLSGAWCPPGGWSRRGW
jgi:hypothetical protein